MGYDFEIVYKKGSTNRVVDALSRRDEGEMEEGELQLISRPFWHDFNDILREVEEDVALQKVIADLKQDSNSHGAYTLENERLHYKGRMVISSSSTWIPKLLAEFHVTKTGGTRESTVHIGG
ncbi:uncharacterized protein LOC106760296 [Vigna radiata var. radiata]|uniref:Uncharacterized protein LOC106760296 n=1 Tax=Vigna radiata var. radiata TaxID=3916 RepID=A0A1S3TZP8_VIGRR|nr:uncharacterized protein LOC106760296 [Vigna radiata var. radiata]